LAVSRESVPGGDYVGTRERRLSALSDVVTKPPLVRSRRLR
jgi:hypothetical protein